jgi:hypothetical protein
VVEVDERIGGPQTLAQLFPGDDVSGPFQQVGEYLERLLLELNAHAIPA